MKHLTPARCSTIDRLDAKQHAKTSSKRTFSIVIPANPALGSHFSTVWIASPRPGQLQYKCDLNLNVCVHMSTMRQILRNCITVLSALCFDWGILFGSTTDQTTIPIQSKDSWWRNMDTLHIWLGLIHCKRTKGIFTRRRKREEHIITHSAGWCWKTTAGSGWKQRVQMRKLETQKSWSW